MKRTLEFTGSEEDVEMFFKCHIFIECNMSI